MTGTLKCRFCDYKTLKYSTAQNGKVTSGFIRMDGHMETEHPDEWDKLKNSLASEDAAIEEEIRQAGRTDR